MSAAFQSPQNFALNMGVINGAGVTIKGVIKAQPGAFIVSGQPAQVAHHHYLEAAPGAFALTGKDADVYYHHYLSVARGQYAITGVDATAIYISNRVIEAVPGEYVLTGFDAQLRLAWWHDADLERHFRLFPEDRAFLVPCAGNESLPVVLSVRQFKLPREARRFFVPGRAS